MNTDFLNRIYSQTGIYKEAFPGEEEAVKEVAPALKYLWLRMGGAAAGAAVGAGGTYAATQNQNMTPMSRFGAMAINAIPAAVVGSNPAAAGRGIMKQLLEHPTRTAFLTGLGIAGEETVPQIGNVASRKAQEAATSSIKNIADSQAAAAATKASAASANFQNTLSKSIPYIAGGAGLLGLGAIAAHYFKPKDEASSVVVNNPAGAAASSGGGAPSSAQSREGQLHVKLPVKRQGDHDTSVDIPLSQLNISKTILDRIGRDTRRRLRSETNANTLHRRKPVNLDQPSLLN